MKKLFLILITLTFVACGASKEFIEQSAFITAQMGKLDTVSTFDALLAFQSEFMQEAQKFENSPQISEKESVQLDSLLEKLTAKMQIKTQELLPLMDSASMEVGSDQI